MTSFSVKKPFTVFVAVVAILVFGVMSYVKMTPDLMPNMDYPYVVVVTTYPGAAPEEVEAVVTKPMEQSMATLNDIKTVTSTSAENYSMLVLEFEQSTNMDSAVVDHSAENADAHRPLGRFHRHAEHHPHQPEHDPRDGRGGRFVRNGPL